jgi:nucleotide-binding universal stress UspA family protein
VASYDGGRMYSSIVVGTDGSETAREAVRQATRLAATVGARIELVSAYEPVPATPPEGWSVSPRPAVEDALREAAQEIAAAGVEVGTYARQGDPAAALLDVAEERRSDLIVVGNKGMTGADRFLLGSVPNKVSHHAPCSVLIIRV